MSVSGSPSMTGSAFGNVTGSSLMIEGLVSFGFLSADFVADRGHASAPR